MKVFNSKSKNLAYFFYRMIEPIFDPVKFYQGFKGYYWYTKDIFEYKLKDKKAQIVNLNLYPKLNEKTSFTSFNGHYFYQQAWLFDHILKTRPNSHVDVASDYNMSAYISRIVPTTFVDIRPIETKLNNLRIIKGDILNLPFKNNSIKSLSCLHVIEHIGLGRYGDKIDPKGTEKACLELSRVLAFNGNLYVSLPVGKDTICFNAYRIYSPKTVVNFFKNLKLVEFSLVDDNNIFHKKCSYNKFNKLNYSCGMFLFKKYD